MTPETKFHATVLGLTVTLMFAVLSRLDLPTRDFLVAQPVIAPIAALFLSAGVYSFIAQSLITLLRHIRPLKRVLLGASYLEGTWVGYAPGSSGKDLWIVEHYQQDLTSLLISGRSFTSDESYHGQWKSEASQIDPRRGQVIFYYILELFNSNVPLQGIGVFNFERKSLTAAPKTIYGYSSNVVNNIRVPVTEHKVSDEIMNPKEAIRKGRALNLGNVESA